MWLLFNCFSTCSLREVHAHQASCVVLDCFRCRCFSTTIGSQPSCLLYFYAVEKGKETFSFLLLLSSIPISCQKGSFCCFLCRSFLQTLFFLLYLWTPFLIASIDSVLSRVSFPELLEYSSFQGSSFSLIIHRNSIYPPRFRIAGYSSWFYHWLIIQLLLSFK